MGNCFAIILHANLHPNKRKEQKKVQFLRTALFYYVKSTLTFTFFCDMLQNRVRLHRKS